MKKDTHHSKFVRVVWKRKILICLLLVLILVTGVIFLGVCTKFLCLHLNDTCQAMSLDCQVIMVDRVIDGDTIVIGGNKLRLIGIDSPELETEKSKGECYADEAKEKLKELVENKEVRLEKDVSQKDKYDRLLRYVYVGEENINEVLVQEGFAKLATYPPDVKYYGKLKEAQRVARENKVGLWGKCY